MRRRIQCNKVSVLPQVLQLTFVDAHVVHELVAAALPLVVSEYTW